MSNLAQPAARRPRARRSQAERSALTRERIIDAVIAVVAEEGFARASSSRIAERAGVTWGAVQHHFGAKADILEAVLDESLARFARRIQAIDFQDAPLEERVARFVDRAWEHYASPDYRAVLEIVLGTRAEIDPERRAHHRELARSVDRLWSRIFAEVALSPARRLEAQIFVFSLLSGLAVQTMIQGSADHIPGELDILKRTLLQVLHPARRPEEAGT